MSERLDDLLETLSEEVSAALPARFTFVLLPVDNETETASSYSDMGRDESISWLEDTLTAMEDEAAFEEPEKGRVLS